MHHSTISLIRNLFCAVFIAAFVFSFTLPLTAQKIDPSLYQSMRWRNIGPFRGGRTVGASGVVSKPNVFYIGVNNGGVWKTTDAGRTWKPIFDDQPTGSIGDIEVAPSNPDVIYAGSGEGIQRPDLSTGDGMYRSGDGGKTWTHLGLRDGQQIGSIAVDPNNENRLFVAVLGHPYGPNEERGVYRSTDGGKTFERVLYKDENTGAIQVAFDPKNSNIIYADMWAGRQGPWENGAWQGKESGLFKSTDGGNTWKKLSDGLPTIEQGLGRIGLAISRSDPKRLFATVDANTKFGGIYASNNSGESWHLVNSDPRLWGRGSDFAEVTIHPQDPNTIFIANTSTYKSTDGGKTFDGFKALRAGTIITVFGSIPSIPRYYWSPAIRGRRSQSTAAKPGRVGITSRRRSFITSLPITNIRTGFTGDSRRAARPALPRVAIPARSLPVIGGPSALRNTAMPLPILSIPTLSTAAN